MDLEIGKILTSSQLDELELISTHGSYEIYWQDEDPSFILAIDNTNLICGCFEFHDREDGTQLAHMYVLKNHQGKGIGKSIIAQAVDIWKDFELPSTNNEDTYYFIEDGYGFINHCFDEGILSDPPFTRPE
jgi:GNAT superfamily N-acetyltransferase